MSDREILLTDVDPMKLVDELAVGAVTDGRGLTLGDVATHRRARYHAVYLALHLIGGLARRRILRATDVIRPCGAEVQDKGGIEDFQAAHCVPCDLEVNGEEGVHRLFHSPIIRGNVKAHVFGKTRIVHRLVNYADRRCEANGWIAAMLHATHELVRDADADSVYVKDVRPRFLAAIREARRRLEDALSAAERAGMARKPLYDGSGNLVHRRPQDFRVGAKAPDPAVRGMNKDAVLQVFREYERGDFDLGPSGFVSLRNQAKDWIELEMQWRAKYS